jgi:ribosomal protein L11 methyltransferase
MQWIEITIPAHPEAVETLSELLTEITGNGVAIDEPYTLEDDGQRWRAIPNAQVVVHAYLPSDDKAPLALKRVEETIWHLRSIGEHFVGDMQTRAVDDEDWAETWKEHFHVTRIGTRTVIKPTWREFLPDRDDLAIIEIDPGMAFGTGTHPTTRLCLEMLEEIVRHGDVITDVGIGSGILSIAALKLGADRALGIDISTVAVRVARENAALNGLKDRLTVIQGTLGIGPSGEALITPAMPEPGEDLFELLTAIQRIEPAPIVVANIIARVIGSLAPALYAATAPGGTLLASGIIIDRAYEALDPLREAGFVDIEQQQDGDWLAVLARRPA